MSTVLDCRASDSLGIKSQNGGMLGWGVEVSDDGATEWSKVPLGYIAATPDIVAATWLRADGPVSLVVDVSPFCYCRILVRNDSGSATPTVVDAVLLRSA